MAEVGIGSMEIVVVIVGSVGAVAAVIAAARSCGPIGQAERSGSAPSIVARNASSMWVNT